MGLATVQSQIVILCIPFLHLLIMKVNLAALFTFWCGGYRSESYWRIPVQLSIVLLMLFKSCHLCSAASVKHIVDACTMAMRNWYNLTSSIEEYHQQQNKGGMTGRGHNHSGLLKAIIKPTIPLRSLLNCKTLQLAY